MGGGNQAGSGVQVSFNGRVISNKLFSAIYGDAIHPSQSRFIAQMDLQKEKQPSFSEGDSWYEALLKLIAKYIFAQFKDTERVKDNLMRQLGGIVLRSFLGKPTLHLEILPVSYEDTYKVCTAG